MRKTKLRGFTLIELITTLSIGSLFFVLTITWIHVTFKHSNEMRARERQHRSLKRLGREFRDDLRFSDSMKLEDGKLLLEGESSRLVEYKLSKDGKRIQKVAKVADGQADKEVADFEVYAITGKRSFAWETSEMPERIGLVVFRHSNEPAAETKTLDRNGRIVEFCIRSGPNERTP